MTENQAIQLADGLIDHGCYAETYKKTGVFLSNEKGSAYAAYRLIQFLGLKLESEYLPGRGWILR
jgi:hypothetical protein